MIREVKVPRVLPSVPSSREKGDVVFFRPIQKLPPGRRASAIWPISSPEGSRLAIMRSRELGSVTSRMGLENVETF